MKSKLSWLFLTAALSAGHAQAQIRIEKTFSVGADTPDSGQWVDVRTISNTGLSAVSDVNVDLVLTSATGNVMRLGDLYATLTHGTASEDERVAVLLNREGATATTPWGSSLSSINLKFDDSGDAANVFGIESSSGTYKADGRLGINPYAAAAAYDSSSVTHGLAALNGAWLASDKWSLMVADVRQGGASRLSSWTIKLSGSAAETGTLDLGEGGKLSDVDGATNREVKASFAVNGSGESRVTAEISNNLSLSGGLSGSGELNKTGVGKLTLAAASADFRGKMSVDSGEVEIATSGALGSAGRLELAGDGVKLTLSNAATLSNAVSLGASGSKALVDGGGVLSGNITGEGGLRKVGSGTVFLAGNASYNGVTEVAQGALSINGSLSGNGQLSVSSGATLKGSGMVNVSTEIAGTHAAGNSPGLQTFSAGLSYGSSSSLDWEFVGNSLGLRGTDYDGIDVTGGSLAIASGATLRMLAGAGVDYSDLAWSSSRSFSVIHFTGGGSSSGNFILDATSAGSSSGYGSWALASNSGDVTLNWTAVPEPSSVAILGGLALLGLARRRR